MTLADVVPFFVVFLLGAAAGRWIASRLLAGVLASLTPVVHLALSVLTGRAAADFFAYVLPVNLLLLAVAIVGLLAGRRLRGPEASSQP